MKLKDKIRLIAFDADDTLWSNEPLFREAERKVSALLSEYGTHEYISSELYKIEVKNMGDYGFGVMAFTLSMLEAAAEVSHHQLDGTQMLEIIEIGRTLLHNPAIPLDGVIETLDTLQQDLRNSGKDTRMIMLTKGELLTQENKIRRSGLAPYFDGIEIVSDKNEEEYRKLCMKYSIAPSELMMIGNSFKSDIAPVLELGGVGVHIPSEILWQLEHTEEYDHDHLYKIKNIRELIGLWTNF